MTILLSVVFIASLSISAFASLVCVPVEISSSAVGIHVCAITAGIKKYKSIIKKKKKEHDKIVLLGKAKLDAIEDLVSKSLIDSFISQEDFLSVNKLLREYNEMGEEIKNPENFVAYII